MADVARLGLTVAGTVIGAYVGGPIGAQIGATIGTLVGTAIFGGGPPIQRGPRLNDLKFMSSAPGNPRPIVYGTFRIGGTVIWAKDIREKKHEESGKGGLSGPATFFYTYTADFAIALCEGPIAAVLRIWADGKLLADWTETNGGPVVGAPASSHLQDSKHSTLRVYLGTSTQEPDPLIQADKGVANTPAYRGTAYLVFERLKLEDYGNRIPQITVEVATSAGPLYPMSTTTATLHNDLGQAVWQPGRQFLVTSSLIGFGQYEFVRYHAPTRQVVNEATADAIYLGDDGSAVQNIATDRVGDVYTLELGFGTTAHVARWDGETFERKATTLITDVGGFPAGAISFLADSLIVAGQGGAERVIVFRGTSNSGLIAIVDTDYEDAVMPVITHINFNNYAESLAISPTPSITVQDCAVDGDGYAWILCTATNTAGNLLYKINPTNGVLMQAAVTLTGYVSTGSVVMTYCGATNSLLVYDEVLDWFIRYSLDTATIEAAVMMALQTLSTGGRAEFRAGPVNGVFYVPHSSSTFYEIDTATLTIKRSFLASTWGSTSDAGGLYDQSTHSVIRSDGGASLDWLALDRVGGQKVTLASIVDDIADRIDVPAKNTSELTDLVQGYIVAQRMEARRAMEPLVAAYFFDGVEIDFALNFPKRGQASVRALTEDDLGAAKDANGSRPYLGETRREEVELLRRMEVIAPLSTGDYQPHSEYAKRVDECVSTQRQGTLELSVAFDNSDEIAQIAEKHLYLDWAGRTQFQFAAPLSQLALDPTDVVTVTSDGSTHTVLLKETTIGADGVISFEAISEDAAVYTSYATGQDTAVPPQTIVPPSPLTFQVLDIPLLRDEDDGAIIYFAAGTYGTLSFPGAAILRGEDGETFPDTAEIVGPDRAADIGVATTVLAAPRSPWTWDRTNTVTVRLFSGSLSSVTELEVLNYSNPILIGDEVMQYATATLNADGSYTLSNLLRGRRGTEWACTTHALNERVVVLSADTLVRSPMAMTLLDLTRYYEAAPLGGSLDGAQIRTEAWNAYALRPYAPCDIEGTQGGSPADWTITGKWRTRIGGEWLDLADALFVETSEDYAIDITVAGSPSFFTITTTPSAGGSWIDVSTPTGGFTALFTEADQRALTGGVVTSFTATAYQLSSTVGRGFGRTVAIS